MSKIYLKIKYTKKVLIFGGTGFVGRAFVEKCLDLGFEVILVTRCNSTFEIIRKLNLHSLEKEKINKYILSGNLKFILNVDLIKDTWSHEKNWINIFGKEKIDLTKIDKIFNLSGLTSSKDRKMILDSNIITIKNILVFVGLIKRYNEITTFINMGSIVEKKKDSNFIYDLAKKETRNILEKSNLCDYQIITEYIKGKGEIKMTKIAPIIWSKLKYSRKWLFGFEVSVVDVDDLADSILYVLNNFKFRESLNNIYVSSGEIVFGEMVKNLLSENEKRIPKLIIPGFLEKIYLSFYYYYVSFFYKNDTTKIRFANFAKRVLDQHSSNYFKTKKEIKRMTSNPDYKKSRKGNFLVLYSRDKNEMYILIEKEHNEILNDIKKSVIS